MNEHRRLGVFIEVLDRSKKDNLKDRNFDKIRLKRVVTTRWGSLRKAAKTVDTCFNELLECFQIIEDKSMLKESMISAIGFKVSMLDFDFIACLKICVAIFDLLLPATTMLQGKDNRYGRSKFYNSPQGEKFEGVKTDESWKTTEEKILSMSSKYNRKYEK